MPAVWLTVRRVMDILRSVKHGPKSKTSYLKEYALFGSGMMCKMLQNVSPTQFVTEPIMAQSIFAWTRTTMAGYPIAEPQ